MHLHCPDTPIVQLGLKSDLGKRYPEGEREVAGYERSSHPQVTQEEELTLPGRQVSE